MRSAASVRFDAYYKIQLWEARSLAWKDVQRSHASIDAALVAAPRGERDRDWRIMEITPQGRQPLPA